MSCSKRLRILGFSLLAGAAMPLLAACSMTPVYSGHLAENPSLELAYAAPNGRLEQIITQELALRFGRSTSPTAPLVTVSANAGSAALVNTVTANPNEAHEVTVTATLTITQRDGSTSKPLTLTRRASAGYQAGAQVLNDQFAYSEASERAAKAVSESLRLALLATMAR